MHVVALALLLVVIPLTGHAATIADGLHHVIDGGFGYPAETLVVYDGPEGSTTSVEIRAGGEIGTISGDPLVLRNNSYGEMSGGEIGGLYVRASSSMVITGGQVTNGSFVVAPSSSLDVVGAGTLSGVDSSGGLSLFGATVSGSTVVRSGSTISAGDGTLFQDIDTSVDWMPEDVTIQGTATVRNGATLTINPGIAPQRVVADGGNAVINSANPSVDAYAPDGGLFIAPGVSIGKVDGNGLDLDSVHINGPLTTWGNSTIVNSTVSGIMKYGGPTTISGSVVENGLARYVFPSSGYELRITESVVSRPGKGPALQGSGISYLARTTVYGKIQPSLFMSFDEVEVLSASVPPDNYYGIVSARSDDSLLFLVQAGTGVVGPTSYTRGNVTGVWRDGTAFSIPYFSSQGDMVEKVEFRDVPQLLPTLGPLALMAVASLVTASAYRRLRR